MQACREYLFDRWQGEFARVWIIQRQVGIVRRRADHQDIGRDDTRHDDPARQRWRNSAQTVDAIDQSGKADARDNKPNRDFQEHFA